MVNDVVYIVLGNVQQYPPTAAYNTSTKMTNMVMYLNPVTLDWHGLNYSLFPEDPLCVRFVLRSVPFSLLFVRKQTVGLEWTFCHRAAARPDLQQHARNW